MLKLKCLLWWRFRVPEKHHKKLLFIWFSIIYLKKLISAWEIELKPVEWEATNAIVFYFFDKNIIIGRVKSDCKIYKNRAWLFIVSDCLIVCKYYILVCKSNIAQSVDLPLWKPYWCLYKILYLSKTEAYLPCINFSNILPKMG